MKIDFPAFYGIRGRLPGKKAASTYGFVEKVEIDIPEVADTAAPISCIWSPDTEVRPYEDMVYETNNGHRDPRGNQITRWYDGRHWRRLLRSECHGLEYRRDGLPPIRADDLEALLLDLSGQGPLKVSLLMNWFRSMNSVEPVDKDPVGRFELVRESARREVLENVASVPDRIIIVNGELYRACVEPFLTVSAGKRPGTLSRQIVVETEPAALTYQRHLVDRVYRAGDFEAAYEHAVADEWQQEVRRHVAGLAPRIMIAEAFTTDFGQIDRVAARLNTALKMTDVQAPGLRSAVWQAARSIIPDECANYIVSALDSKEMPGSDLHPLRNLLEEALALLDDRQVTLDVNLRPGRREHPGPKLHQ